MRVTQTRTQGVEMTTTTISLIHLPRCKIQCPTITLISKRDTHQSTTGTNKYSGPATKTIIITTSITTSVHKPPRSDTYISTRNLHYPSRCTKRSATWTLTQTRSHSLLITSKNLRKCYSSMCSNKPPKKGRKNNSKSNRSKTINWHRNCHHSLKRYSSS